MIGEIDTMTQDELIGILEVSHQFQVKPRKIEEGERGERRRGGEK